MLTAAAGCSSTGSGIAGAPDAQSDASLEPPRVIGGAALSGATECAAAGGQCEVGAVCGLEQALSSGPCGPVGAVCCLHVLCAADATVRLVQASDYDRSCVNDSDCVAVPVGNACTCDLSCGTPGAINETAEAQYLSDMLKMPSVTCNCLRPPPPSGPAAVTCCVGGTCQFTSQCSSAAPAGDAAAGAGADAVADGSGGDAGASEGAEAAADASGE
jgi:hypothetical protein